MDAVVYHAKLRGAVVCPVVMIAAYFDESSDQQQERIFVVAGYIGLEEHWRALSRKWATMLSDVGIAEFHAVDCEHGTAQFAGMSRRRRQGIQRRFVELLADESNGLIGIVGAIMLGPYARLRQRFRESRRIPPGLPISGTLDHPYYLAFQLAIESAAINPAVTALPAIEKLDFVFDRHSLGGRIPTLFGSIQGDHSLGYSSRLASVQFHSRTTVLPLQAADLLAYEAYRFGDTQLSGNQAETRWQFSALARRVSRPGYLDEAALLAILGDEKASEKNR